MIAGVGDAGHDGAGGGGNRIIVRRARSTAISDFRPTRKDWRQTRVGRGRAAACALLHAAFFPAAIVGSRPIEDVEEA